VTDLAKMRLGKRWRIYWLLSPGFKKILNSSHSDLNTANDGFNLKCNNKGCGHKFGAHSWVGWCSAGDGCECKRFDERSEFERIVAKARKRVKK
jgi:hypothetical protein